MTEPLEPTEEPEKQRTGQVGSHLVINAGLVLNYTVGNLDKWTVFEVKVRAVTVAPGPFSDKVIVGTSEDGTLFFYAHPHNCDDFSLENMVYDTPYTKCTYNPFLAKHCLYPLTVVELYTHEISSQG